MNAFHTLGIVGAGKIAHDQHLPAIEETRACSSSRARAAMHKSSMWHVQPSADLFFYHAHKRNQSACTGIH